MNYKKIAVAVTAFSMAFSSIICMPSDNLSCKDIFASTQVSALENAVISESGAGFESAYVKWNDVSGADGYNVYYRKASDSSYTQLDNELIRKYSYGWRADAVGLPAGSYTLKVVPVSGKSEDTSKAAETSVLSVEAYNRDGFAHSNMSEGVGAYNNDGSLKENAVVLYVTEENKNNITMDVYTSDSKTTSCTGISAILKALQKGYEKRPIDIRLVGQITASGMTDSGDTYNLLFKSSSASKMASNITVEGIGDDATCYGFGIRGVRMHSFEIRNVAIMLFGDDGIALQDENSNVWIHNNDIFYGTAGSDADQAKGDGSMDLKNDSQYITISYNHFWDSGKMSLCGMKSETGENWITYHHNWFDHSDSRHPRIRTMTVHVYNNYYDGNAKYGVGVTMGANAFVEANYFRNCPRPMMSSKQGSDALGEGTFSGENGGVIKSYNNIMENQTSYITYQQDSSSFDAYEASERNEEVPSSVKALSGGTGYNNFDTSSSMYSYTADNPADVPSIVMAGAGRLGGGDFKWEFDNSKDDADYSLNSELMAAIKSYKTELVSVGGNSVNGTGGNAEPVVTETPEETTTTSKPTASETTVTTAKAPDETTVSQTPEKPSVTADAIYCSPDGNGDGSSVNSPASFEDALTAVKSGGVIYMLEGTYKYDHQITIAADNSGSAGAYKSIKAYNNADVKIDFSSQSYNMDDVSKNDRGLQINGNYWHVYGIRFYGAADNGMYISGKNNRIEMCVFEANRDTGLQIGRSGSSVTEFADWPSDNLILNCTSFNNMDPATGENADGFAAKLTCGNGNTFDGCISYNNVDDGWDLYAKSATGPIGVVTIRNCISFRNGQTSEGVFTKNSDGNGFKLGGGGVGTAHVIENCISFENKKHGFTDNNNPLFSSATKCTSYSNGMESGANFQFDRCTSGTFKDLLSFDNQSNTSDKFNGNIDHSVFYNSKKYYLVTAPTAIANGKTGTEDKGPSADDFENTDVPALGADVHKLWRNADGSINVHGFLQVKASSAYKDMGAKFDGSSSEPVVTEPVVTVTDPVTETSETVSATASESTNSGLPAYTLLGDATLDNEVDVRDVTLVNQYVVKMADMSEQAIANADVIKDNTIDLKDLGQLKKYLIKVITEF